MLEELVSDATIYQLHDLGKASISPNFSSPISKMGIIIPGWHSVGKIYKKAHSGYSVED